MGYSAKAVANFFIEHDKKKRISPMKLQKLVYISHGWYLALYDEYLIDDEYAEAWQYGPVYPSLYHEFKHFGWKPVTTLATDIDEDFDISPPEIDPDDERTIRLLRRIWKVYGGYTGKQLSSMTHSPGTPWHKAYEKDGNRRNPHIDEDDIKNHYLELYRQNEQSQ